MATQSASQRSVSWRSRVVFLCKRLTWMKFENGADPAMVNGTVRQSKNSEANDLENTSSFVCCKDFE